MIGQSKCRMTLMSGTEFRLRLRELGRTDAAFAEEIGCSARSVSRWVSEGPPSEIAYIIDLLLTLELSIGASASPGDESAGNCGFDVALNDLLARASMEGRKAELFASVRRWLELHSASISSKDAGIN